MVVNNPDNENIRLMSDGQAAAKRGDKALARALLTQVLERDPHNEQAWVWLSGAVTDPQEQQTCLENALLINPNNNQARKGLKAVSIKTGIPPRVPALPGEEPPPPANGASWQQPAGAGPAQAAVNFGGPVAEASQVMSWATGDAPAMGAMTAPSAPTPEQVSSFENVPGLTGFALPDPASGELPPWEVPGVVPTMAMQPDSMEPITGMLPEEFEGSFESSALPDAELPHTAEAPFVPETSQAEHLPFDLAPFQPDGEAAEPATYTGGPPAEGLPPDTSNAVPEWVREVARQSGPLNPIDPPAHQDAGAAVALLEPQTTVPEFHAGSSMAPELAAPPAPDFADWLGSGELEAAADPSKFPMMDWSGGGAHDLPAANSTPADRSSHDPFATPQAQSNSSDSGPFGSHEAGSNGLQSGPFGPGTSFDLGALGPYSSTDLPTPDELPGQHHSDTPGKAQPWYLESSNNPHSTPRLSDNDIPSAPGYDYVTEPKNSAPVPTIECPNCRQHVPETVLNCPECSYSFFVHCPHCHELVDTTDARAGVTEKCPYCSAAINKLELGLINTQGIRSIVHADPTENSLSWTGAGLAVPKKGISFGWLADLFALAVIVLLVWVLAQLPMWFSWTHLYN
jgi:hypothetical protein